MLINLQNYNYMFQVEKVESWSTYSMIPSTFLAETLAASSRSLAAFRISYFEVIFF